MGPKPMRLKKLCEEMAQSERTIRRWVKSGCPHHKGKGLRGALTFDHQEVLEWCDRFGRTGISGPEPLEEIPPELRGPPAPSPQPAVSLPPSTDPGALPPGELSRRTKLVNLKIKILEAQKRDRLEKQAAGELVATEEILRAWAARVQIVHDAFDALPGKLAPELVEVDYDTAYSLLERELHAVLKGFSETQPW